MPTWIFFLVIGVLFLLMMRGGCGSHAMGHGHGGHGSSHPHDDDRARADAPKSAVDPVCGMTVETVKAKSSMHAGTAYFFCSSQCRDKFEQAPESYLKKDKQRAEPMEHHHG